MKKTVEFRPGDTFATNVVKYHLENPNVRYATKIKAIKRVAEIDKHNDVTKADLIFALKWLFIHYDFEE